MKLVEPLSSRVYQLAEEYQLGEPQAEYFNKSSFGWMQTVMFICAGGVFIATWFFLLRDTIYIYYGDWLDIMVYVSFCIMQYFLLCFGGLFLLLGLASIFTFFRMSLEGVGCFYLCREGILAATRNRVLWVVRKEEVRSFQQRIFRNVQEYTKKSESMTIPHLVNYTITAQNGQAYSVPPALGELLVTEFTEEQWPATLDAYQSGKEVHFGWIVVTQEGLRLDTSNKAPSQEPRNIGNASWQNMVIRLALKQQDRQLSLAGSCIEAGERFITWKEMDMPWLDKQRSSLIIERRSSMEPLAVVPLYRIVNTKLCLKLIKYALEEEAWKL